MKKKSYEEVKAYIESFGYELLSTEYINNSTKLDIICPKGHKFKMAYTNFQQGQRCPICADKSNADKQRLSYDEVKNYIERFGYKLLSKENIRAKENDWKLIRIPYWDFDRIEEILNKEIKKGD